MDVDLAYATQQFRRRPGDFQNLMAVVITQAPPIKRFGVALAVECDRWSLTLGGMFWLAASADRDAMARRVMETQTASASATFLRGVELRRGALRQLSSSLVAARPEMAEALFDRHVADMVRAFAAFRVVRSVGDAGEFRWVEPGFDAPAAPSPPWPVADEGLLQPVPGGWWLTVDEAVAPGSCRGAPPPTSRPARAPRR